MEGTTVTQFDASRFLELLLSSPELKVQLKSVQELNRKVSISSYRVGLMIGW